MSTETLEIDPRNVVADLVAKDKDERIVLVVESLGGATEQKALSDLTSYLTAAEREIPFAMLVDLEKMQIFKWDGEKLSNPICSLNSSAVLSHYEPEFSSKRIFDPYLRRLVEVWLDDCAYHWKSEKPPASEQLAAIGLLQLLDDGTTQAEVNAKGDPVR